MLIAFLKGCAIGFSIAAPVGPIGVLCIRRSLEHGARTGFFTGLGATAADGIYGAVAAFGLTAVSEFIVEHRFWLRLGGGMFLLYLGVKVFLCKPSEKPAMPSTDAGAFTSTFFLTLTNPMTIFSFIGIFAGLGVAAEKNDYSEAVLNTVGILSGSGLWWLLLSSATAYFRSYITRKWMRNVNRVSGLVILAFAVKALWAVSVK